jgi:hypothetical protein
VGDNPHLNAPFRLKDQSLWGATINQLAHLLCKLTQRVKAREFHILSSCAVECSDNSLSLLTIGIDQRTDQWSRCGTPAGRTEWS